ncbi:MAG: hypothetical protein HYS24_03510 [Ignavibacteriales bacterium]|nr:hypothetical protein [Ignavibacteriales bacterium]
MKNNQNEPLKQDSLIIRCDIRKPYVQSIIARLNGEERYVGNIDISGEGTFQSSRKENHVYRKTNSLGIAYAVLNDERLEYRWIVLNFMGRALVTTRNYFQKNCHIRHYNNYELQCFLPIEKFGRRIAEEFDKSEFLKNGGTQTNLFGGAA